MASQGAQPGNQNARKGKLWANALRRALARKANGTVDNGLDQLADKLLDLCAAGDLAALKELGDRLDGKPAQAVVGDDDEPPVRFARVVREIVVRANPQPSDS